MKEFIIDNLGLIIATLGSLLVSIGMSIGLETVVPIFVVNGLFSILVGIIILLEKANAKN